MPLPEDVIPLVRKFANNSYRYLFRQPDNVAELVRWREPKLARRIAFADMTVLPDTFVTPDFAALESDMLLQAPFRLQAGADGTITLFILIEHQSEPDPLMIFRVIRYVVMIYERQAAEWLKTHSNLRQFAFEPVLPIVFYSGTRTWEQLQPMHELVRGGKLFEKRLPNLEPEFIRLATTSAEELQKKLGTLGWVLWLVQQSKSDPAVFRDVLAQAVRHIDGLRGTARGRWQHLLWFAHALVYHARQGAERQEMAEFIRETVRKSEQGEVQAMGKTIAEVIKEEGIQEGLERGSLRTKRELILRALQVRFNHVPAAIEAKINATEDVKKLQDWFDKALTAKDLSEVQIPLERANRGKNHGKDHR